MDQMELIQASATAIQDLGIYDMEDWGGGFNNLYIEIREALFNGTKFKPELYATILHLEKESFCGASPKTLALVMSRVGGQIAFMNIANKREFNG